MSKTKEFILSHNAAVPKPQLEGVYNAMDEYAAQVLSEYKEKLKRKLTDLSVDKRGRMFATEIASLIDRI